MDVTCERCGTAYEFDDALVSERGTTVKCTNCGHQFKVRRAQAPGAPERWLVRTIDGRELEFRALRELQAAIAQALITRDDVLSRGGSRPRRLGSIAELEPFFSSAAGGHPTNLGLGPHAPHRARGGAPVVVRTTEASIAIPLPGGLRDLPTVDEETHVLEHATTVRRASVPPPPRRSTPPPGVVVGPAGAPPPPFAHAPMIHGDATAHASYDEVTRAAYAEVLAVADSTRDPPRALMRDDVTAPTVPFAVSAVVDPAKVRALIQDDWAPPHAAGSPPATPAPPPAALHADHADRVSSSPLSSPPVPSSDRIVSSSDPANLATPTPAAVRVSYMGDDAYSEPRFSGVVSQRRSGAARWIVGMFITGMVVLAFATVGRKMLLSGGSTKTGVADARVGALLSGGEKSLAEGDLELAKEQFDKASVLAERDARVLSDLARLATAKADIDWLRARLLAPDDPEQAGTRRRLEQAVQRARHAADRAAEVAASDPAVARSRIDALRLEGDLAGARKLVAAVASASSQPENALVLAELDLAEAKPDWSTVIARLRTAVSGEGNLGRARALLVYAMARSNDVAGAKAELERLKSLPRSHPLAGALTAYLARVDETVDVSALPDASAKARAEAPPPTAAAAAAPTPPPSQRDRPTPPSSPEPPMPSPPPDPGVPLHPNGPIDTSDLPGMKVPTPSPPAPSPPPASPPAPAPTAPSPPPAPAPPPTNTLPPGVDTSDLPGFK